MTAVRDPSDRRLAIEILTREGIPTTLLAPAHIAQRPVQLGAAGEIAIPRQGIAPLHLALLVRDGRLLVSSVDEDAPAFTDAGAIPSSWTELALPGHVLLGETVLHLFWCLAFVGEERRRGSLLVRKKTPANGVPLPRPSPPPRRPLPPLPPPRAPAFHSSDTKIHVAPAVRSPPPTPPPLPHPFPMQRLGDALSGPVLAPRGSRSSSPTLITDLRRRAGLRPNTVVLPEGSPRKNPIAVLVDRIVAAWRRFAAAG